MPQKSEMSPIHGSCIKIRPPPGIINKISLQHSSVIGLGPKNTNINPMLQGLESRTSRSFAPQIVLL